MVITIGLINQQAVIVIQYVIVVVLVIVNSGNHREKCCAIQCLHINDGCIHRIVEYAGIIQTDDYRFNGQTVIGEHKIGIPRFHQCIDITGDIGIIERIRRDHCLIELVDAGTTGNAVGTTATDN